MVKKHIKQNKINLEIEEAETKWEQAKIANLKAETEYKRLLIKQTTEGKDHTLAAEAKVIWNEAMVRQQRAHAKYNRAIVKGNWASAKGDLAKAEWKLNLANIDALIAEGDLKKIQLDLEMTKSSTKELSDEKKGNKIH